MDPWGAENPNWYEPPSTRWNGIALAIIVTIVVGMFILFLAIAQSADAAGGCGGG